MTKLMTKLLISLTCFFLLLPLHASALGIPKLQGYVNDYANLISGSSRAKLEEELRSFEQSDSTQLVILTLSSLEGETVEDYSIKVVEAWKLGKARKDNGILFLVSKNDRQMRIEVGRGLEGRLTDLMAGRIIDLVVKPRFKRGDFDGGVTAGVASLIDATRGEFKSEGEDSRKGAQPFHSSWLYLFAILSLFFFFLSSARKRGNTSSGRGHGGFPGGFVSFPSGRGGGGNTFGGGGGTFGGGGASGSW
jgi:uncharacterized protein